MKALQAKVSAGPTPVLYLDHTAKMGGGEIALLNLVRALDRTRYEPVVVLASDGPLTARLRDADVETHVLPLDRSVVDTRKDSLGAGSLGKVRQAAAVAAYAVRLAAWARRRGVRIIHTNSLKSDLYGGVAGRLAGLPALWHVRDSLSDDYLPPAVARLFRALARRLPRAVLANSAATLRHLEPIHPSRACVVHDGLDAEQHLRPLPETPAESDTDPIITLVGRIAPWKGQHVFLRAAVRVLATHPCARFWVVGSPLFGEDEYEQSLHALARDLGLTDHVTFWGFREDVADLITRSTVLVHASTLGEPFGQVVIEGMAAAKPVVATDGGALPEIVDPGVTGLLTPMGDADALADAVTALLNNPARAAAMGRAGRERVRERFTSAHVARNVERVYDRVLGRSS